VCFVIVTSLRIVTDGNKETTYLLTYFYFFRVAIETVVSWRQPSKPLNWCKKSGDAPLSSTTILFQMLSVAVQRGNAVSFLCTFPQDYSVILQLLLTVSKCAALCYRVLKIMILILVIILISIISFLLLSCVSQVSCPPWKMIFTCRAVYALLLQALLDGTGFYIIYTCYPLYMKTVLNYDVKQVTNVFTMNNMLFQNNGGGQRLKFLIGDWS